MRDGRRHHDTVKTPQDARESGERDRDRILYTAEFRRLAGITQVAAADTGHLLHNRLTHVLEVAQIGRRLAQRLIRDKEQQDVARAIGGVDPEIVEAACLAHDLGHPPFGHITEEVLDEEMHARKLREGFEGNAQSFRIIATLAERRVGQPGLDLTRAALNALLKYPWARGNAGKKLRKWNYYSTEAADFKWARELDPDTERKSAEAELMDWSDDIAYSVHDLEDFYQAGKIPLDRLTDDDEVERFLSGVFRVWKEFNYHDGENWDDYAKAFEELIPFIAVGRPYVGDAQQRHQLRTMTAFLIDRYINALKLKVPQHRDDRYVEIDPQMVSEVTMLKELTWHYVIRDPSLATQQEGQRAIIRGLFRVYFDACCESRRWHLLPPRFQEVARTGGADAKDNDELKYRITSDLIAGMTEQQAVAMYHRFNGVAPGSALTTIMQ